MRDWNFCVQYFSLVNILSKLVNSMEGMEKVGENKTEHIIELHVNT
jgi:hypothetical protein